MSEEIEVGQDDGRFGFKTVCVVDGRLRKTYLPSRLAFGTRVTDMGGQSARLRWFDEGTPEVTYVVTDQVEGVDTRFSGYDTSAESAILTHASLVAAGLGGKHVRLITGLPVKRYFKGGSANNVLIDAKTNNLRTRQIRCADPEVALAVIEQHTAVSEGVAAYYNAYINLDGSINESVAERAAAGAVAVIDVGGETTDVATIIESGNTMDSRRSGTADIGTLSLIERLAGRLSERFDLSDIAPRAVNEAAMSGRFRLRGAEEDVTEVVASEKSRLVAEIKSEITRRIGKAADMELILLCGGGVLLLRDELLKAFPHAEVAEDPQFANAIGMWKIARFVKS